MARQLYRCSITRYKFCNEKMKSTLDGHNVVKHSLNLNSSRGLWMHCDKTCAENAAENTQNFSYNWLPNSAQLFGFPKALKYKVSPYAPLMPDL